MLIPRSLATFFPSLNDNEKNPRVMINFFNKNNQTSWGFNLIHYNNKLFGGTRFEYRLTRMTGFFREYNVKEQDLIEFSYDEVSNIYFINLTKSENFSTEHNIVDKGTRIFHVSEWEVVE